MNNIIKRVWNQNRMVNIEDLSGMAFQSEAGGHTFEISGIDNDGNAVALSGTVSGVFMRPDHTDVALTGSASDGVVSVTLDEDCYAVAGRFGLTIFVTADSKTTAIYAAVGTVVKTSNGTVAGDTPANVVDLINAISAAVATIPADYTDLMAAIAPTYSNTALYAVGSYVWYSGNLYRCTTAITTAESWTAAHWKQVALGDDVADLKSTLKTIYDSSAYTTEYALVKGRYFYQYNSVGSNPSIDATAGKNCAINIEVARGGGSVKISIDSLTANATIASLVVDSQDKITRRWVTSAVFVLNSQTNKYEWTITPADNEYQVLLSIYGGSDACKVEITPAYSVKEAYEESMQNTSDIAELTVIVKGTTTTNTADLVTGRYIYSSNTVGSSPVKDSSGGKYCVIDTGVALNGGKIKISIDSITSNQTVSTLLTDANDKITDRWVTYDSTLPSNKFDFNSESNKFESIFEITNQHKLYFSINGGSNSCTVEITPPELGVRPETYYVDVSGSDENTGLKSTAPFATLKRALSVYAKNINILSDLYEDVVLDRDVTIFGNGHTIYGDIVLETEVYNSILRAPYTADKRITNCYVNETTPLTETVSGSDWKGDRYNICCYADDEKLLPVADVATCEATENSFTWSDGYFYINASGTRYSYCDKNTILNVTAGNVEINDLTVKHTYGDIIAGSNCSLELNGCVTCGSVNWNCVSVENGQLVARNTEVSKCWNDGINTHSKGNSTIIDCYCHDCSDDGISQHDNTTGVIVGGEFCRCGKGGISSPINSAKVDIYNAYIHDNSGTQSYGIYASSSSGTKRSFRVFGCVIANNRIGLKNAGHDAYLYGNKFSGNTTNESTDSGGTTTYLD